MSTRKKDRDPEVVTSADVGDVRDILGDVEEDRPTPTIPPPKLSDEETLRAQLDKLDQDVGGCLRELDALNAHAAEIAARAQLVEDRKAEVSLARARIEIQRQRLVEALAATPPRVL
jgi:hypothetical protein